MFVSGRHLTWYGPSLAEAPAAARGAAPPAERRCQTAVVLLADAVAVLHGAAVLFMLTGSLLALRWPRVLWLHVPVSLAILGLYLTGSDCPLTSLELALRERAGRARATRGGFIGHYITEPLGFPIHATSTQVGIYVIAFLPNVIGYGLLARQALRQPPTRSRLSGCRVIGTGQPCALRADSSAELPPVHIAPGSERHRRATGAISQSAARATACERCWRGYSNECSGPGKTPPRTSSAYSLAARSSSPRRSAYFFTNFGTRPPLSPAMSGQTSTWASQSTPAPMPIVGMDSSLVTCPAISAGTISRTTANAPASCDGVRVGEQLLGAGAAALHPEAAEGVLALRREADVRHHRDAGVVQQPDLRGDPHAALELDRLRAALLHEPDGGVEAPAAGPDS